MIHTIESLRKIHRRQAEKRRRQAAAARILETMRQGAVLHRYPQRQRSIWMLNSVFITHSVALEVLRDPHVAGVDSLFKRELPDLARTFQFVEAD